jgi:hypothetical protein
MRVVGFVRKVLFVAGSLAVASGLWLLWTLPPRARPTTPSAAAPTAEGAAAEGSAADGPTSGGASGGAVVRGAWHVHTTRSDGSGTIDEVAAAAARAGLGFLIITDHGDGTRAPLPPAYRSGVLCIDAVEISTTGGHYVALGLPRTTWRLAGEPRDVVEDVARLGGAGIAAHPDSPKRELAWTDWSLPFDGVEWLNLDTEWRDESRLRILTGLVHHLLRPVETVASLVGHSSTVLDRWDGLVRERRVIALAAVDAHARFGVENAFGRGDGAMHQVPSYETSFRAVHVNARLDRPLTGRAADDAAAVVAALRDGRVYSAVAAFAPEGRVELSASSGSRTAGMGQFLQPDGPVSLTAFADAPVDARLRLICDGRVVRETPGSQRLIAAWPDAPPVSCRLEVGWRDGARFARWIVTNPIYLRAADAPRPSPAPLVLVARQTLGDPVRGASWTTERDPGSQAMLQSTGSGADQRVSMAWTLRAGERRGQYAALVTPDVESLAQSSHLTFVIRADRAMRVSVQVRAPAATPREEPPRWRRSIYVDATPREVTVALADMTPAPPTRDPHPSPGSLRGLLFVVDTDHTLPGDAGTIQIERLVSGRP